MKSIASLPKKQIGFLLGLLAALLFGFLRMNQLTERPQIISFNPSGCFLPCVLNIYPGRTELSEVFNTLNTYLPHNQVSRRSELRFDVSININDNQFFVAFDGVDSRLGTKVEQIDISLLTNKGSIITLGDLINAGYVPEKVFRNRVSGGPNTANLLVVFDNQIVSRLLATNQINSQTPIVELTLISQQEYSLLLQRILDDWNFDYEISWLGFAPIENYLSAPGIIAS